ncbi:hypothetical protein [Malaciobacter marinus]|uniref:hypothetical protein n=1 Tax=Malaciobacter marinus TaxID=505249 RepID=UPI0009A775A9|nr:hypothetical protein [Malaciobacter marinus]SKB79853.1 hypothetical protein SAMN06295997_1463 [Malaciobacter marinus]
MLLLDEMELTREKLKGTPRPKKSFILRKKNVEYKQAVVKHLSNLNKKNIDYAMFYIAKHSENFIVKDENGNEVKVPDVLEKWKKNMSNDLKSNEAIHLAFSIDENKTNKNIEALENSVKDVLKHKFYEYSYVYTIHKHQGKPHVHAIINKRSKLTNRKMHFKEKGDIKKFYKDLRDEFAENLNHYNEDFNYYSEYNVERDIKYKLLKKTIDDLKKKMNLNNNIIQEAKENIEQYKTQLEDINKRIQINLKEKINQEVTKDNHKSNLKKIKNTLKRNKELTRIKKDIEKNISKQETLIRNTEFIIKEAATKDFVDTEHTLKFFQSKMNKRNMTLSQYFGIEKLSENFKELKFFYNIKIDNELKSEKDEIQLLSMTTNAFKIYKFYKQAKARRFENKKVIKDKDMLKKIDENIDTLKKIFKEREHEVNLMIRKTERTIELNKDKNSIIEKKNKELDFLKKELDYIEKIKDTNFELNANTIDFEKNFNKFKTNIKDINKKTSIFKIQKILAEKQYIKENTNDKEKLEYIEKFEAKIKNIIDIRALQNYKLREHNKKRVKSSATVKDKTKILKQQEFLKKESDTIDKIYNQEVSDIDRKVFISKFETKLNEIEKKDSIYKLIDLHKELTFRTKIGKNKDEIDYLEQTRIKLKTLVDDRALKNYKGYKSIKENLQKEQKLDNKVKYANNLLFLKKEKTSIERIYKKFITNKDKQMFLSNFEERVNYLNDSKSIYTINNYEKELEYRKEFNITNKKDESFINNLNERIKLTAAIREDKVKRTITYYVDKLNKELTDEEIIDTKKSLKYMKQENKDIKNRKQKNAKIKEKDIEIQI